MSRSSIDWPPALVLPAWSARLRWGMSASDVAARGGARVELDGAALLQGLELVATLVFELDRLVRVELTGRLDELALAALGCSAETLDDVAHHRLVLGGTRVAVDALDGLVALEPEEIE